MYRELGLSLKANILTITGGINWCKSNSPFPLLHCCYKGEYNYHHAMWMLSYVLLGIKWKDFVSLKKVFSLINRRGTFDNCKAWR